MVSTQPTTGSRGRAPGQGSGRGRSRLELNAFLYYHNLRSRPVCHEICWCKTRNFVGRVGAWMPLGPLDPPVHSYRMSRSKRYSDWNGQDQTFYGRKM